MEIVNPKPTGKGGEGAGGATNTAHPQAVKKEGSSNSSYKGEWEESGGGREVSSRLTGEGRSSHTELKLVTKSNFNKDSSKFFIR